MKTHIICFWLLILSVKLFSQLEFENVELNNVITKVQPMTGIVYWDDSGNKNTDAISLEYSYMLFNKVVKDSGSYNWDAVETKLNAIAERGHQAIFRFRYVYPGYETSVPEYILNRDDYNETIGDSEGKETHFPDWENEELMRFSLEFYTKFAEKYDSDPRLAFIQVGFGLWAEYHIYSGPFILGKTFPSKEFQEDFFQHLNSTFTNIPWSISIDAADDTYSPFEAKPELKDIPFGLFDDSFMHSSHAGYNTSNWNFFNRERYKTSPAGGEFSYYSDYDQAHVLDYPEGPYGKPYENFAKDFHITYMIGNDQPSYQKPDRIKEASMASGYRFKIVSLKTAADTSVFEILNYGVAPIYYDAFITVDGIRSDKSLKLLAPGESEIFSVQAGAKEAQISIESDKLVSGQEIEFFGTQDLPLVSVKKNETFLDANIYPNPILKGEVLYYSGSDNGNSFNYTIYNYNGSRIQSKKQQNKELKINTSELETGVYFIEITQATYKKVFKLIVM